MKNYQDIPGWFDYKNTYDFLLSKVEFNGIFVECGAWFGKSSAYLCDKAHQHMSVYIVDTWEGSFSETDPTRIFAEQHKINNVMNHMSIYDIFIDNMGDRKFIPIKKISDNAALDFQDGSCDVVFIDLTHTYEHVSNDIKTWLPKVKHNGYLAGHDYQKNWPGVIRAVDELLGKENIKRMDTCWIYQVK